MNRTRVARHVQRGALACAAVVTVIAVLPVGPAAANDPVPDTLVFSGAASAIGTQAMFNTNPEPSNVPDVFDLQVPVSNSTFDSSGQADAVAHLANGNGATQIPGLLCLAGVPCSDINGGLSQIPGGIVKIPPDDPTVAHADLPSPTHSEAPTVGGQAIPTTYSSDQASVGVGHAVADVAVNATSSSATSASNQIPLVIDGGGATTSTDQHISKGALVTTATSTVSDVTVGELVRIKSVKVVASVSSLPGKDPVDTSTATASGVTFAGQPATIDQSGLHVPGMDVNQVQGVLLTVGILDIRLVGVKNTTDDSGYSATASGIAIKFDTSVSGLPVPSVPPQVVQGCESAVGPTSPLSPITSQFPVDACTGVGASPNAEYYGTMLLGQAGVVNQTATEDDSFDSGDTGFSDSPTDTPSASPSSPAVTNPVVTTPPSGGDSGGVIAQPGTVLPGPTGTDTVEPQVAPAGSGGSTGLTTVRRTALGEDMLGVHKRLLWIYPVILLSAIGILAGRIGKAPARIPRTG